MEITQKSVAYYNGRAITCPFCCGKFGILELAIECRELSDPRPVSTKMDLMCVKCGLTMSVPNGFSLGITFREVTG